MSRVVSLKPSPLLPVPEQTAHIAHAAFPKGSPYLKLRDELGTVYRDEDFAHLFPVAGQPGLPPWQLALVTVLQFRENLSDRQAAEAVRARIDWKYLLGLELGDPGFDSSVLTEFRARLMAGGAEELLLGKLLEGCRTLGLVKARGRSRTDSTHVLASIRVLNRLELVAETLRAALNQIATVEPDWLRGMAPPDWYERYGRRIEDRRLPRQATEREAYARTVGEDGFLLLAHVDAPQAPAEIPQLPQVQVLRTTWRRHYERHDLPSPDSPQVRFKTDREVAQAVEQMESPYDPQARFRTKSGMHWTGYAVHVSETCEDGQVHLITQVKTTTADRHEATCTAAIHQGLAEKDLSPREHLVDAGYISADLLVQSQANHGIDLIGPTRKNASWQNQCEGAYDIDQFELDWEHKRVCCPQGKLSSAWSEQVDAAGNPSISVMFRRADCRKCSARSLCTRSQHQARHLKLQPRPQYQALKAARERLDTEEGKQLYARRAGIEGTISQGVRAFGLRRTRYRGLVKTHLQHIAIAAAINVDRIFAWLEGVPLAATRTSRFAALAA